MEVVVPYCVDTETALLRIQQQTAILAFVLRDYDDALVACRFARATGDVRDDVPIGFVEDLLRRVESQAVDVEFRNPVASILDEQLAHSGRTPAIEVQRVSPFGRL